MNFIFFTLRKLHISVLIVLFLQGCINRIDRVNIQGKFEGISKSYIYISKFEGDSLALIDSIKTSSKGHFQIKIKAAEPYFVSIGLNRLESPIILLVQPGEDLMIKSDNSTLIDYKVFGSNGSALIHDLTFSLNRAKYRIDSLRQVYKSYIGSQRIDSVRRNLDSIYTNLIANHHDFVYRLVKDNTYSPVSILALSQSYDSVHPVFDYNKDRKLFRLVDSTMLLVYSSNRFVKSFHAKIQRMDSLNNLYIRRDLMFKTGDVLPNVGFPLITGDNLFISSIWFKYILVDFQAPWCTLCKVNNNHLRKIYSEYAPKGFVVIQVTLGVNSDSLKSAVLRDSLLWYSAFVPDIYNSKLLDTLKITSLPSSDIADRWGVIKATNLSGEKLRLKLKELLPQ